MGRPASYLYLDRELARACIRFRIRFGPDLVSLRKRGVIVGNAGVKCRFCIAETEDAEHVLFHCVGMAFLTHKLWSFNGMEDILVDGADWQFIGQVLREVYEKVREG